jgi:hypothetical protein
MIWLPLIFENMRLGPLGLYLPNNPVPVEGNDPSAGLVALGSSRETARERRTGAASGCDASMLRFPALFNFDHFAEIKSK